ncbi:hypothetical protein D3C81_1238450 [compost metagenome]
MLAVQPLPALENPLTLVGRHTRPVVLDAQGQTPRRLLQAHAQLAQAQAVGVFQQVAQQLQQRALLHRYLRCIGQLQGHIHPLVPVNLGQGAAQAVEQRAQQHAVAHQATLAQARTLQLVVDLLAHTLDLALQHPRLLTLAAAHLQAFTHALQHRQRCLQAVRQVVQRIAVALALLALAAQQAVQRAGQAQQFTRVFAAQAIPRSRLHIVQLAA